MPGTGRAVELGARRAARRLRRRRRRASAATCRCSTPRTLARAARRAPRAAAARATLLSAIVDDADRLRPHRARRRRRARRASSSRRTPTPDQLLITEINSGTYVFGAAGAAHAAAARRHRATRRARSTSPTSSPLLRAAGQARRRRPGRPTPGSSRASTTACSWPRTAARLNALIVRGWQLAGVTVHDPATTWIDLRATLDEDVELLPGTQHRAARRPSRAARASARTPRCVDCEVGEDAIGHAHRRDPRRDRRRRIRRPVRLPAPRHRARRRRQDRHLRRDQEREDRRGQQGAAPLLHRRHDGRRGLEHRRRHDHRELRRREQARHRRSARTCAPARTTCSSPRSRSATAPTSGAGTVVRKDVPAGCARDQRRPAAQHARAGSRPTARAPRRRRRRTRPHRRPRHRLGWTPEQREGERVSAIKITGQKRLVLVSGRAHPWLSPSRSPPNSTPSSCTPTPAPSPTARSTPASTRACAAADMFVIQSHTDPINEWLMEQLIMVDAAKRASAKRITVVAPFYPYARQDKKGRGREPISARLVADLFKAAGADRIMSVDLHAAQIQGFFDGPVDHLFAMPVLLEHFQRAARPVDAHRRQPRHGPRARRRHLERQARRAARDHPQAPRPAGRRTRSPCTRSSARSRAASA